MPGTQAASQENPFRYRADIDGLRGLAVTSVVLFHMQPRWLPGGFTGVDIFFVMSGYVVTGSLLKPRRDPTTVGAFFLAFYSRRVKRLTPALVCVTFVSSLLAAVAVPPYYTELDAYLASAQLGLVGWVNNYYAGNNGAGRATANYFEVGQHKGLDWNPFTHYWSLSVEEQFYFCFPVLLLCVVGRHRMHVTARPTTEHPLDTTPAQRVLETHPVARAAAQECELGAAEGAENPAVLGMQGEPETVANPCQSKPSPARTLDSEQSDAKLLRPQGCVCLAMCWMLSAILCAVLTHSQTPRLAFYLMPARFWQLLSGSILFMVTLVDNSWFDRYVPASILSVAAAILLGVALVVTPTQHFPFPWSLPVVCGTLSFIAAGSKSKSLPLFNRLMAHRAVVYVGKISYPIYLWHWPLLVAASWVMNHKGTDAHGVRGPFVSSVAVVVAVILSALTYHYIEGWFRKWQPKSDRYIFRLLLPLIISSELCLMLLRGPLKGKLCLFNCVPVLWECAPALASSWGTRALTDAPHMVQACTCADHFPPDRVSSSQPTLGVPPSTVPVGSAQPACFLASDFPESRSMSWYAALVESRGGLLSTTCFDEDAFQGYQDRYGERGIQMGVHNCLGQPQICGIGNTSKRVFLLGDSHAGSLYIGLRHAVAQASALIDVRFLASGCNTAIIWDGNPNAFKCTQLQEAVLVELAKQLHKGDAVVVTMIAVRALLPHSNNGAYWRRAVLDAFPRLHNITRSRGATLILLGDIPGLGRYWGYRPNAEKEADMSYAESNASAAFLHDAMHSFAVSRPREEVVFSNSLFDSFCQDPEIHGGPHNAICSGTLLAGSKAIKLFYDSDHLNDHGSMYLWPWLCNILESIRLVK